MSTRFDRRALFTTGAAAALLSAAGVAIAQPPRRGGQLRIAVAPFDGRLAPCAARAVFDTLTEIGPDGVLRAELATGWRADDTARHWQFKLRQDAVFHDGTVFEAASTLPILNGLAGIRAHATNTHELRLELNDPNPNLPYQLACQTAAIKRNDEVGTGLYRVSDLRSGKHFRATRFLPHYKDDIAGWPEHLEVITLATSALRAEALRDGYVDIAEKPDPDTIPQTAAFRWFATDGKRSMAARADLGIPARVSAEMLDGQRIAERWWI